MAFSSKYQAQIDDLYNQLANRSFSYDYQSDPLYQQYATQYTNNGKKAMEDTYGMVAARTGGLGSSYANVAAQNAYGNYMSELAAKIPELEEIARSNFNSETDRLNSNLSSLMSMRDDEYNQYVQEMNWYYNQLAAQQEAAAAAAKSAAAAKEDDSGAKAAKTSTGVYSSYASQNTPSTKSTVGASNSSAAAYKASQAKSAAAANRALTSVGLNLATSGKSNSGTSVAAQAAKNINSPFINTKKSKTK